MSYLKSFRDELNARTATTITPRQAAEIAVLALSEYAEFGSIDDQDWREIINTVAPGSASARSRTTRVGGLDFSSLSAVLVSIRPKGGK